MCCSFKCIISMFRIHILAAKVSLILLYVHRIVNMYFRHEYMLYVYMYKHVIVILCNTVFELFIITFIINVFIIIILREFRLLMHSTIYIQHSSKFYNMILNISISRQEVAWSCGHMDKVPQLHSTQSELLNYALLCCMVHI